MQGIWIVRHVKIREYLSDYHENDIADILKSLSACERKVICALLGFSKTAQVFTYFDEPSKYVEELSVEKASCLISHMDSDDAVDTLETLNGNLRHAIEERLETDVIHNIQLLRSYEENEIGRTFL